MWLERLLRGRKEVPLERDGGGEVRLRGRDQERLLSVGVADGARVKLDYVMAL